MYRHILFDLDGTLTDPAPGIIRSLRYALGKMGVEENTDDQSLLHFIGPPLAESFQAFYHFSGDLLGEVIGHYREHYGAEGLYDNTVYPGMKELLAALQSQGRILYVATTKLTSFAHMVLDHFNLSTYFNVVVGGLPDGTRTAKSEIIKEILATIPTGERASAVMVGDRKYDIIGARTWQMDTIAVTYGYGSQAELTAEEPTYVAGSVEELAYILSNFH
jgi:phosphoglycolate phosphatase